ncbi:MAG: hypothetical protein VYB54_07330 [Pseudomonadota bacterium]|nr:hypothetical protein [Pseudomonadota bacterium]
MKAVFDSPTGPLRVDAPPATLAATAIQAPAWPRLDSAPASAPLITQQDSGDGTVRFRSTAYAVPDFTFAPGLMAGNGLVGALIGSFTVGDPGLLCLHAGAVEQDGRLTVLLGQNMAGKSTLAVALAAAGLRFWCDDRLPVDRDGLAFALALRPKLRLPLPTAAPAGFRAFVASRTGTPEADMVYLDLEAERCAGWGERLPLGRLLVLDRQDGAEMRLDGIATGEVVKALVPLAFAPHMGPLERLQRLRDLAESCPCQRLAYSDSFRAATFLATGGAA